MNDKYIIDRIEGKYAILEKENGDICKILIKSISGNFDEGDILIKEGCSFKIDKNLTRLRKDKIDNIVKEMWE